VTLLATIDDNVHWDPAYNIRKSDASNIPIIVCIGYILIDTRKTFTLILIVYNINNQCHVNNDIVRLDPLPNEF
jgi:hypothetical protein